MRSRTAWKLCPAASSSGVRSPSATATAARRAASSRLSPSSASTAGATTSHLAARAQELPDELPFGAAAGAGGGADDGRAGGGGAPKSRRRRHSPWTAWQSRDRAKAPARFPAMA